MKQPANNTPLSGTPDVDTFSLSATHDEALARLLFLLEQHRRLGLLLGSSGVGKTTTLTLLAGEIQRQGAAAVVLNPTGLDDEEFVWQLAVGLGLNPGEPTPRARLWRMAADRVAENRYQLLDTAVLIDDADQASPAVQTALVRLAMLDSSPDARLTIVLAVDPDQVATLHRRLLELAELRIDLEPWTEQETIAILRKSLDQSGIDLQRFDESAMRRIFELSRGVPRSATALASLAMIAGASNCAERIEPAMVEAVYDELYVVEA